jgi:hypothetical protein
MPTYTLKRLVKDADGLFATTLTQVRAATAADPTLRVHTVTSHGPDLFLCDEFTHEDAFGWVLSHQHLAPGIVE